jgi:tRNA (guanine37-N1)-methyltransferase
VDFIREEEKDLRILLMSPQGKRHTQAVASELSMEKRRIVFICGHYEGIDERVRTYLSPEEVSIGDYVLTGGELAALVIIDSAVRLIPDVLGDSSSVEEESFNQLLDYPHYTRPAELRGMNVPPVLLSGNHEVVRLWRRKQALINTLNKRRDMLDSADLSEEDIKLMKVIKEETTI